MNSNVSARKGLNLEEKRMSGGKTENEMFNWKNERFSLQEKREEREMGGGEKNRIGNRLFPLFQLLLRSAVLFILSSRLLHFPIFSLLFALGNLSLDES